MSSELQTDKAHVPYESELRRRWSQAGGSIPDDWKIVTLETLLKDNKSIAVGVMYPGPDTQGGIKLIKVGDIKGGLIPQKPNYCISPETNEEHKRTQLIGDELLITLVGNPGECVVVTPAMAGWNPARAIAVIRLAEPSLRVYLKTVLESAAGKHLIDAVLNTTVQKTLNLKDIRQLPVPMPRSETIRAISSFSEALSDRIGLLRETNATLEAMAQALFKSWFVDFDPVHANAGTKQMINPASSPSDFAGDPAAPLDSRLRGNDDLLPPELQTLFPATFTASPQGLVPEGWKWLELDEAYELNPKRNLKKGTLAKYLDMASVGTSGHTAESAINREFSSGTKFINGDTLLARITPCLENGKTAFVDFLEEDEIGWGSTEFIVMRPKAPLPAYHAYLLARFPVFREFAIQSMSGTSGRQRVQNDVLGRYMLAVPDSAVAELFGQTVEAMQQKIAANHQQAQTLATLRDTLLPRLISGQLRLPDADAMQAEVCDV
ncbi:MAG: restriction endonuclease subunit S [Proteobacteria bacterium]|nr:restriction endonuclease subunit S [Pseudomonadota bacterium]